LSSGGVIQTASGNGDHSDTISSAIGIQGASGTATFTLRLATTLVSAVAISMVVIPGLAKLGAQMMDIDFNRIALDFLLPTIEPGLDFIFGSDIVTPHSFFPFRCGFYAMNGV